MTEVSIPADVIVYVYKMTGEKNPGFLDSGNRNNSTIKQFSAVDAYTALTAKNDIIDDERCLEKGHEKDDDEHDEDQGNCSDHIEDLEKISTAGSHKLEIMEGEDATDPDSKTENDQKEELSINTERTEASNENRMYAQYGPRSESYNYHP